jgi:S1-C subfamily serine protease
MDGWEDASVNDRSPSGLRNLVFFQSLLLIGLSALMIYLTWPRWGVGLDPTAGARLVTARGDLAEDEKSTIGLFKAASPSVVHITSIVNQQDRFTLDVTQLERGSGTGFVWDDDGRIVTNFHVIQQSDALQVTLQDGTNWRAQVIGAHPDRDLAVLAINAPRGKLQPLPLGSSSDLQVGQKVFAIGNPFGLDQSLTTGVISALGRQIESVSQRPISGVIQTDAAINPGNSGGPLLDSAGRLIGVNTAIYSRSGAWSGVGFAIPVDIVNEIVPQLIRHGKIDRAGLGITVIPDQSAAELGVHEGVAILNIVPDGPAHKAGLRPTRRRGERGILLGDVIKGVDRKPIRNFRDLAAVMTEKKVGDVVTVEIERDRKRMEMKLTLEPTG